VPIVREADGLALSSRNVHLDRETRAEALALPRALDAAERAVTAGVRDGAVLLALVRSELQKAAHARVDYAELCDPATLAPAPSPLAGPTLLALAVRFPVGGAADPAACVRLIDNRVLHPEEEAP
jgi:pantoate--beta-alanine ligase